MLIIGSKFCVCAIHRKCQMNKVNIVTRSLLQHMKQKAKQLKQEQNITHTEALNIIAVQFKFSDWEAVDSSFKRTQILKTPTAPASLNFIENEDIVLTEFDLIELGKERKEDLSDEVKLLVDANIKSLVKLGIEFSVFEPTRTGLNKAIIDATQQVRTHFELTAFHLYNLQFQGQNYKKIKAAKLLTPSQEIDSQVSLYRPVTKKGDPRMWFRFLPEFADAGDQIAIVIYKDIAYLLNLSLIDITLILEEKTGLIYDFLQRCQQEDNLIANELLDKLRALAKKPIKATHVGDTAVGMTIEHALGIEANSSKLPDYRGIELKAGRGTKNRSTLFAQVADWDISPCKRSADILDKFGYYRDEDLRLYCTVNTQRPNSQGLVFKYDEGHDELQEWSGVVKNDGAGFNRLELVAVWPGSLLRKRLKEKHTETFWIEVESELIDGHEYFNLKSVTHTKAPILSQLMPLLANGTITMDHLIKKKGDNGRVSEKGPLFKMDKKNLNLLFPDPVKYKL